MPIVPLEFSYFLFLLQVSTRKHTFLGVSKYGLFPYKEIQVKLFFFFFADYDRDDVVSISMYPLEERKPFYPIMVEMLSLIIWLRKYQPDFSSEIGEF